MLQKIKDFLYNRIANSNRAHPLYIIPTIDGLKVVALNITLLVIGLIYANNYVLLFNFILFCLFLGSMFYTHFNLNGLKLESIRIPSLHVNESGMALLHFSTKNSQGHNFIRPYFKNSLLEFINPQQTFNVSNEHNQTIRIAIKGQKRGVEKIHSLYIETLFPFNFFRCFTFFKIEHEILVYPERSNLNEHLVIEQIDHNKEEGDEFILREYQIGDSLKRVDWKKLAQSNRWHTRQFQKANPNPVVLVMEDSSTEESLKSICFALHLLHSQNIKYGIKLGNKITITPANSLHHLNHCLRELATYEA